MFKVNFMLLFMLAYVLRKIAAGFVNRDLRVLAVWGVRAVREN